MMVCSRVLAATVPEIIRSILASLIAMLFDVGFSKLPCILLSCLCQLQIYLALHKLET